MSLFWELHQQRRIHQANSMAAESASTAHATAIQLQELEDRLERLSLVCRAMWTFLQESQGLTEEQLFARVLEVDLIDGQADGRVKKTGRKCRQCGRVMSNRHHRCMYCGAEELVETVFDTI